MSSKTTAHVQPYIGNCRVDGTTYDVATGSIQSAGGGRQPANERSDGEQECWQCGNEKHNAPSKCPASETVKSVANVEKKGPLGEKLVIEVTSTKEIEENLAVGKGNQGNAEHWTE